MCTNKPAVCDIGYVVNARILRDLFHKRFIASEDRSREPTWTEIESYITLHLSPCSIKHRVNWCIHLHFCSPNYTGVPSTRIVRGLIVYHVGSAVCLLARDNDSARIRAHASHHPDIIATHYCRANYVLDKGAYIVAIVTNSILLYI